MYKMLFLSLICFTVFYGCRLGPRYERPFSNTPEEWKASDSRCPGPKFVFWWEIFGDDTLHNLELQAIENNQNIYVAIQRVKEARAIAGISRSDLFPHLNLNPSYLDTGTLFKIFLPSTALPAGFANIPTVFRIHQMEYVLPLNLNYDVDLWGKLHSQYESALLSVQAQIEALNTALLSISADLASAYFQMRMYDTLIDLYKKTIEVRKKGLNLTQSRFDKGIVNYTDVANASLSLTDVESDYYNALRERRLQENLIATLIGLPASEFCLEPNPLLEPPPTVPAGIPSNILLQRPDIAEAERKMASEHALLGSAYASFFPSLSLTGTLGFSSPTFKDFLTWKSRLWSIGANASQTVFDAGRNYNNLEATWARFREASGEYQQLVLTAFQEVEDALNNIELEAKQAASLRKSVTAATKSAELTLNRYKQGVAGYLDVVVVDSSQLDAQRHLIDLLGQQYLATIQLIKALGGTWETDEDIIEFCNDSICCEE